MNIFNLDFVFRAFQTSLSWGWSDLHFVHLSVYQTKKI